MKGLATRAGMLVLALTGLVSLYDFIELLRRAATEHGAAVICVTHDPRLEAWADRVIHIEDGVIIDDQRRTPNPDAVLASHH